MVNSRELVESALGMDETERIPAMYQYLSGGPEPFNNIGLLMEECYHDAHKFARASKAVQESFGYDNVMAGWGCIVLEAHTMGTEVAFPRTNAYPQTLRPALRSPEMIDVLQPADPWDNDLMRIRLQASGILVREYGEDLAIIGNMLAPAMIAWELRGYEDQLMDMFFNKDLAHQYLGVISESVRLHGERLYEQGVDIIFLEDDFTANAEYVPVETAREFDLDYAAICVKDLQKMGHRVIIHNCTKLPLIEEQVDVLRPEGIHYNAENVPEHAAVCQRLKGITCLCPGVPEDLVYDGPEMKITASVNKIAADVNDHPGFIMASAYEVPFKTKPEHQKALVNAIHSLR